MTSLFDVDYANDQENNAQGRRATAAALARTKHQFGAFLSGGDIPARFDLIESDFRQVIAEVVLEYGGDVDRVESAVTTILSGGGYCSECKVWKSGPRAGTCTCDGDKKNETHEHEDGPDEDDDSGSDDGGGTFSSTKQAAAGFCPSCGTQSQMLGKMGNRDMYECPQCHTKHAEFDTDSAKGQLGVMPQQEQPQAAPGQWDTSQSVAPPGLQPAMAHWHVVGEALETEKLPKVPFGGDTLDGPSPKMDHKEWKPDALNENGNLKPIDTEGKGSPHPTEHHDIARSTDHTRDFLEQTRGGEGVTETEKLKGHDDPDKAGFDTKKNVTQYPTRTFGDKGQQDSGVGDAAFPKAAFSAPDVHQSDPGISGHPQHQEAPRDDQGMSASDNLLSTPPGMYEGQGRCPNCNGPADPPQCPHCGYSEHPGQEHGGDPAQTYGGGHEMDDPDAGMQQYRASSNVNCEQCEDRVNKGDTRVIDGLRLCPDCRGTDTSDEPQTSDLERDERSSSADPDKNPIRESLRAQHGVLPQGELDAAISNFRA